MADEIYEQQTQHSTHESISLVAIFEARKNLLAKHNHISIWRQRNNSSVALFKTIEENWEQGKFTFVELKKFSSEDFRFRCYR